MASKYSAENGFTLLELMIVIVIVAILTAIAYPSYLDYIRKGKRSQAMNALETIRLEQEKWRVNNTAYSSNFSSLGLSASLASAPDYTLSLTANSATGFTATATGKGTQANDTECKVYTINQDGPVNNSSYPTSTCWKR